MNNLYKIDFNYAENLEHLAIHIGMSIELLEQAIDPAQQNKLYLQHLIPKRGRQGGYRIAYEAINSNLADAYKAFARRFDIFARNMDKSFPHKAAYGYIRKKSTLDNARNHCGAAFLLRADLANFFPSISTNHLIKVFMNLNLKQEVAEILARFVTIDGQLPLGLPCSPMLVNLVCLELDKKIEGLANLYNCSYSRYADDIAISGLSVPSRIELSSIVEEEGFILSDRKFRITKLGQAHYVTGLSVSDIKPHAPRFLKKRLRQELYYCKKFGIKGHLSKINAPSFRRGVNRLDGMVHYIANIERDSWPNLEEEWKSLLLRDMLFPHYLSRLERPTRQIAFYIDETEIDYKGKKFLALGLVQTEESLELGLKTEQILENYLRDPFTGGKKSVLRKKRLHFNDADEELRTAYIKALEALPLRAYIIYGELTAPENYEELYLSFIESLIFDRLIKWDGAKIQLFFEENSKVKAQKIESCIRLSHLFSEIKHRRGALKPEVYITGKIEQPCYSAPDFLLGVFSHYATCDHRKQELGHSEAPTKFNREKRHFERLRDKYRLIIDADAKEYFTWKNPFKPWG